MLCPQKNVCTIAEATQNAEAYSLRMCWVYLRHCADKLDLQYIRKHLAPVELQQDNIQLICRPEGAVCATCCCFVLAMHWVTAATDVMAPLHMH
jgi:hypothetical protein